jgi:hypothetical protein
MHQVGLEPTIPVFEREKTVHGVDRADTVIGSYQTGKGKFVLELK